MKKILSIFMIGLLLGCSLGVQGFSKLNSDTTKRFSSGDYFRFIMVDGRLRSYRFHIPPCYDNNEPSPIVFVLHGCPASSRGLIIVTEFNDKADDEGFIVVYPNGFFSFQFWLRSLIKNRDPDDFFFWNFWDGYNIDDVGYIDTLIEYFLDNLNVNSSRIYMTGISGGGCMSYRLGAELSDTIAAIAPVAGSIGGLWGLPERNDSLEPYLPPEPSDAVPVIVFHGMRDYNVPYDGGWLCWQVSDEDFWIYVLSVDESVSFWVEHNNCNPIPKIETSETENIIKKTYTNGNIGSEVVLYTVVYGGHEWFGSPYFPPCEISATDIIWDFFEQHPKQ